MDVRLAARMIEEWASANADTIGIDPKMVRASYIYNPGGFGNLSIRLSDGNKRFHVKLAPPNKAARLQQWAGLSVYLTEHYTAPRLVHVIDREIVPGYPYGLVFEYIEDATPLANARNTEAVLTGVLETIAKPIAIIDFGKCYLSRRHALMQMHFRTSILPGLRMISTESSARAICSEISCRMRRFRGSGKRSRG